MLFNSYVYILLFLPVVLLGYYMLPKLGSVTWAKIFLLGMSFWFYGYFNPEYLAIMLCSIAFNYAVSQILLKCKLADVGRKFVTAGGIVFNVGILFYFKYYDFFVENVNSIFNMNFHLKNLVLPLGISFFTMQQISYIIDSYKNETTGYSCLDYALFVSFFPQLIAGPIVYHDEIIPQFRNERNYKVNWENMARGLTIFVSGLAKKVLLADVLGKAVEWGFSNVEVITSGDVFVVALSYTLQIYFDFSGYCDMAMGTAMMLNIKLPQNFNSPYKADSILDFWKRWHMTLTRFLRQYVYFPLGGGKKRKYLNIFIVFLISGVWHGANWTFILWGILHGIANILTRIFQKTWDKLHEVTKWVVTFGFLNLTWIIFRAESLSQAITMIRRLVGCEKLEISKDLIAFFKLTEFEFFEKILHIPALDEVIPIFYVCVFLLGGLFFCLNLKNNQEREIQLSVRNMMWTTFLMVYCVFSLSGISIFLYFNF